MNKDRKNLEIITKKVLKNEKAHQYILRNILEDEINRVEKIFKEERDKRDTNIKQIYMKKLKQIKREIREILINLEELEQLKTRLFPEKIGE